MNFKKVNNITGWAVFFIALLTYFLTREARGSLWDSGEFASSAYKMQLPHPPGAPLFVLLGRFFIILFGDNGMTAANAVNTMSALASAATILFLFWTITHFARKMFVGVGEDLNANQVFSVMAAGAVGALAYTFSDSFWFSAGEAEVYALSSFFTALVFWLMLKWEHADEKAGNDPVARTRSDRWIVLLFFMMGLSIGVHILNLLTIPAVVMIYYYRRYQPTTKGSVFALIIGLIITGIVQLGVIQYSMKAAGQFDVFFTNSFGLPFFGGFTIYFIAIAALVIWALRFTEKNIDPFKLIIWFVLFLFLSALPFVIVPGDGLKIGRLFLLLIAGVAAGYFIKPSGLRIIKLSLWCYAFMMLGYSMYFTSMIRSNSNPAVDMNNVDNPINLVYYLSREQYGEAPLVYGPHFAARVPDDINQEDPYKEGEMRYVKGKNKYIPVGRKTEYNYNSDVKQLFPRVWDPSNDQYHADFYAEWLNLGQDPQTGRYDPPTYSDNFQWFFTYQMGLMYWRYFMWNFSGKQNDIQGLGNKRDGNWITGIPLIDNQRLGNQDELPDSIKTNKANNKLFMLPFLLGILGCVYQYLRNKKDWIVTFLIFFMTGIAVVLYLNQPGNQPRERDYAYVGSFYAFAIWIGLAVIAFLKLAREKADKELFKNTLIYGSVLTFLITLMSGASDVLTDAFMVAVYATILFAAVTAGITFLIRAISSGGENTRILNISTTVICLLVPLLMANQEWDDHDRSKKTLAPDLARNYLESCAPNAVLFTFGDNDTYPLWYAQEVEGVRPDIRIINNSLLGIDWYINQLRYKVNNADSLDVIWSEEQIEGHNREYLRYRQQGDGVTFYNLYNIMKNEIGRPYIDPDTKRDVGSGSFPVARFYVPVDTARVRKNGTVTATDSVLSDIRFVLPEKRLQSNNGLMRSDLIILNIIATNAKNGWNRPIYFTSPYNELGFGQYLRKEGLAYRLVPVQPKNQASDWLINIYQKDNNMDDEYQKMMNKFVFESPKGIYFDEENRRHVLNLRNSFAESAGNMADAGKKEQALKLLEKSEKLISADHLPYAMVSRGNQHNINGLAYLEACYKVGNMQLANTVKAALKKDFEQQKKYYDYLKTDRPDLFAGFDGRDGEAARNDYFLQLLSELVKRYDPETAKKEAEQLPVNMIKPLGADSAANKDSAAIKDSVK